MAEFRWMDDLGVDEKEQIKRTYNAATDHYEAPPLAFWNRFGAETVSRLNLKVGDNVLDICSGAGASALPAARAVGAQGRVTAVEMAHVLLERAKEKACIAGLSNIDFLAADFDTVELPPRSFNAVICVFGIFFLPDMAVGLRRMAGLLRPGGLLAITTWGPNLFEPGNLAFWKAIREVRPDLHKGSRPWDQISSADSLRSLLEQGGLRNIVIEEVTASQPLNDVEDWWVLALGSGYRWTVDQLSSDEASRVKELCLSRLRSLGTASVETNVIFSRATSA